MVEKKKDDDTKKKGGEPKKDRLSRAELAEKYGYVAALIDSDPELKRLFARAYGTDKKGQWTAERFAAELKGTNWYKNHSAAWRTAEALYRADPKTYEANKAALGDTIEAIAGQIGANVSPAQVKALAESYYRAGYDQTQIRQALTAYITTGTNGVDDVGGQAGESIAALREYADSMGVKRDGNWLLSASRSIAGGLSTVEDWTGELREEAKSKYAAFAPRIDAGMSVRDLAGGYLNQMSSTLELNPDEISLDDPTIQQALIGQVDSTSGAPVAQSLWDFDKALRKDPRWALTKNANEAANSTALTVLQAFGLQG